METPITIPEWTWVKIADAVTGGVIIREETTVYYYRTYKKAGELPPDPLIVGEIPGEAVKLFEQSKYAIIDNSIAIDVYLMCANNDDDNNESGKVMVNL